MKVGVGLEKLFKSLIPIVVIFFIVFVLAGAIAIEYFFLIFLGMEYDSWRNIIWFILACGVIEFIFVLITDFFISKSQTKNPMFHRFFCNLISTFISFSLVYFLIFDGILHIETFAAVIYVFVTSIFNFLLDAFNIKNDEDKDNEFADEYSDSIDDALEFQEELQESSNKKNEEK